MCITWIAGLLADRTSSMQQDSSLQQYPRQPVPVSWSCDKRLVLLRYKCKRNAWVEKSAVSLLACVPWWEEPRYLASGGHWVYRHQAMLAPER